jgi:hypothetical protein
VLELELLDELFDESDDEPDLEELDFDESDGEPDLEESDLESEPDDVDSFSFFSELPPSEPRSSEPPALRRPPLERLSVL